MSFLTEADARALMGPNFFGIAEWAAFFNAYPDAVTNEERAVLSVTPWTEELFNAMIDPRHPNLQIRQSHSAFLAISDMHGKALTIPALSRLRSTIERRARITITPDRTFCRGMEFEKESFLQQTCRMRWYLMPLYSNRDLIHKHYETLKAMLTVPHKNGFHLEADEPVDTVAKIMQCVLYHQKTGRYPSSQNEPMRCNEILSTGRRVTVWCTEDGIQISSLRDGQEYSGLATSLEHPTLLLESIAQKRTANAS